MPSKNRSLHPWRPRLSLELQEELEVYRKMRGLASYDNEQLIGWLLEEARLGWDARMELGQMRAAGPGAYHTNTMRNREKLRMAQLLSDFELLLCSGQVSREELMSLARMAAAGMAREIAQRAREQLELASQALQCIQPGQAVYTPAGEEAEPGHEEAEPESQAREQLELACTNLQNSGQSREAIELAREPGPGLEVREALEGEEGQLHQDEAGQVRGSDIPHSVPDEDAPRPCRSCSTPWACLDACPEI